MSWNDGKQITIAGESAPESNHGPALAVDTNAIYVAYVGEGGENLYLSYRDINPNDPQSWLNAPWGGNKRVKLTNGSEPQANDRPAIAIFPGSLQMVYTDQNHGLVHSLQYGGVGSGWINNGQIDVFPAGKVFNQPLMTKCSFKTESATEEDLYSILHLFVSDQSGTLWYTSQTLDLEYNDLGAAINVTPWQPAQQLMLPRGGVQGVKYWSLTAYGETAYLLGFTNDQICIFRREPTDPTWEYFLTQYPPNGPIDPWAAASPFGDAINLVFTPKGNSELYTASSVADDTAPDLTNMIAVGINGVVAKTNKAPSLVPYPDNTTGSANVLMIAYKANSSDKLYFAYTS